MYGVWWAIGRELLSTWRVIGSAFVTGSTWCGQLLDVDAANVLCSHLFILRMFPVVHGNGIWLGLGGGFLLRGQPHGAQSVVQSGSSPLALGLVSPALGNDLGIM